MCIWKDSGSSCGTLNNLRITCRHRRKRNLKFGSRISLRPLKIGLMCIETSFVKIMVMCLEAAVDSVRW
jgi:hypothetical protein